MKNDLKILQDDISAKTINTINQIIVLTNAYTSEFDKKEIFSFSNKEEQTRKYYDRYFSFVLEISPMISKLADLNAALASLLMKADTAMETEIVITCEKRFNAYEIFEKSFYEYTSNIENAFENSSVTPTFIINTTQKLKNSLNALINENL